MKKKVGIIKRIFSLLLVFLFSINSFAAVVSDNDGSAFITKAEFDSLKNSFQSQINNYNQSIDSKIDGAIASYLAGLRIVKEVELENLLSYYGGKEIKWGWNTWWEVSRTATAGYSTYVLNGWSNSPAGYAYQGRGAAAAGIKDPAYASWWSGSGEGALGNFFEITVDGSEYVPKYFLGQAMCQCIFMTAWYNSTKNLMTFSDPWGGQTTPVTIGEALNPVTSNYLDCWSDTVRKYSAYPDEDFKYWTSPWIMPTSTLYYVKDQTIADSPSSSRKVLSNTSSGAIASCEGYTKNWTFLTTTYDNLNYGTVPDGLPHPKIYQGIPLCKVTGDGEISIENLTIASPTGVSASSVYFAISDGPFNNNSNLTGHNITLNSFPSNVQVEDATNHVYRCNVGANISKMTFTITGGLSGDGYIYIKVSPKMAKPAAATTVTGPGTKVYTTITSLPTIIERPAE